MKNKKNKKFLALFQMDPLENLNFDSDTTINLIKEAIDRNIDVWIGHPKNLSFSNENASIIAKKVFNSNLNFGKSKILKLQKSNG